LKFQKATEKTGLFRGVFSVRRTPLREVFTRPYRKVRSGNLINGRGECPDQPGYRRVRLQKKKKKKRRKENLKM